MTYVLKNIAINIHICTRRVMLLHLQRKWRFRKHNKRGEMRFYDREQEITFLRETWEQARTVARFTVLTGRRRIGKDDAYGIFYTNTHCTKFFGIIFGGNKIITYL